VLQHQILTDKSVAEWLRNARQENLNDVEQANLREMTRQYEQAALLPESLVEAKSLAGSRCEHAWRSQRPANDWGFCRKPARGGQAEPSRSAIRAGAKGGSRYDALLDIFEPDMTSARLDVLFADLKSWLPTLLASVVEKQSLNPLLRRRGRSRSPNSVSWDWKPCGFWALILTAGVWISAPIRSAAACRRMCASPPAITKRTCSAPCSA
jgi:carboxypeptidase Taq